MTKAVKVAESAFRRGGLASQINRITSQHHTTVYKIRIHKVYKTHVLR
jgi:hypothetical protein